MNEIRRVATISEILKAAWRVFARNFGLIVVVTLVIGVPLSLLLQWTPAGLTADPAAQAVWEMLVRICLLIAQTISFFIACHMVHRDLQKRSALARPALRSVTICTLQWLWTATLGRLVIMLGYLLFVIPGLALEIYFAFALPAQILDGTVGHQALKRSRNVVGDRWWTFTGRLVVIALLVVVATLPAIVVLSWLPSEPLLTPVGSILEGLPIFFGMLCLVQLYALSRERLPNLPVQRQAAARANRFRSRSRLWQGTPVPAIPGGLQAEEGSI